MSIDTFNTE